MSKSCKKCGNELRGMQESYCSLKCSRRHLKSLWQKRKRSVVNKAKRLWRIRTKRYSDECWRLKNLHKEKAHKMVDAALKKGILIRKSCKMCKNKNTHAHHKDYAKPLTVIWLCPQHHVDIHKKL